MKIRLADYVADFLVDHGISDCFMVVGGGAMHLNDALGHRDGLKCTFTHHEQGAAIAAEAYARLDNKIAAVCVTTGPGGTNALTGVLGGWLESIPMFIISGQVRYDTTARFALKETGAIVTAEEHSVIGGLAGAVCEVLAETEPVPVEKVGINDQFGQSGKALEVLEHYGLTAKAIVDAAKKAVDRKGWWF